MLSAALQASLWAETRPGLRSICLKKQEVAALARGSVVSVSSHTKALWVRFQVAGRHLGCGMSFSLS